jgi:hypothetical protein
MRIIITYFDVIDPQSTNSHRLRFIDISDACVLCADLEGCDRICYFPARVAMQAATQTVSIVPALKYASKTLRINTIKTGTLA